MRVHVQYLHKDVSHRIKTHREAEPVFAATWDDVRQVGHRTRISAERCALHCRYERVHSALQRAVHRLISYNGSFTGHEQRQVSQFLPAVLVQLDMPNTDPLYFKAVCVVAELTHVGYQERSQERLLEHVARIEGLIRAAQHVLVAVFPAWAGTDKLHQMVHLPATVARWGPLHNYDAEVGVQY